MFGKNDKFVSELTSERDALSLEVERLKRLQPGGLALEYASHFDAYVQDRVSRDYDPMNPETGIPLSGMDIVFDNAMRTAAQESAPGVLAQLDPERRLGLMREILPEKLVEEIAVGGLKNIIQTSPTVIGKLLDKDQILMVISALSDNEEIQQKLIDKLISDELPEQSIDDLSDELEAFGHISTDRLPIGEEINACFENNNKSFEVTGRVVKTKDGSHWVDVTEFDANSYGPQEVIPDHSLVRFGHKNGEGEIVFTLVPNARAGIIFKHAPGSVKYKGYDITDFCIDGERLF